MLKLYCTKCGSANVYSSEKPRFCQKCGTAFNKALASQKALVKNEELKNDNYDESQDEDDDGERIDRVPDIKSLEVEITYGRKPTDTFESLIGTKNYDKNDYNDRPKDPRSSEQIMEEFKKESSTLRRNKPK